jgi:two-component system, NarL family, response regulator NreC
MDTIKILLADDHKLLREGLRALIEEQRNMTVVAEAEDGRSAVRLATKLSPDIIVMDISMPGLNGIDATRQITAESPGIKVIALSMHADRNFVVEMFKAGAAGYLLKDCAFEELILAIRAVSSKKAYLSSKLSDTMIKDYVNLFPKKKLSAFSALTAREREVLQLLAEGKSTREVAAKLNVSTKTVETFRRLIMKKLDIHSVAELTKYAIRTGLTSLDA